MKSSKLHLHIATGRGAPYTLISVAALVALAVLATGCLTPRSTSPTTVTPVTKTSFASEQLAGKEVAAARKMIEDGGTSEVIPRLLHTIAKYPDSQAAVESRYWLGMAYYDIAGYRDAIDMFKEYLRLAPAGQYAADSEQHIAQLSEEYNEKYPSPEQLDEMIASFTQLAEAYPGNMANKLELADLHWRRGNYDTAAALYDKIAAKNPAYKNDEIISKRVEWLAGGKYIVLNPAEVEHRQIEAQPLAVINTTSFRGGPTTQFTGEYRYYSVTGQVVNRSDSVLYGIEVVVTVYGFGNIVYDTTTVGIRRLNPGEIRAFSVRLDNFENIENISRYECKATFQR